MYGVAAAAGLALLLLGTANGMSMLRRAEDQGTLQVQGALGAKGFNEADEEATFFANLDLLTQGDLKPGDIIFKKTYGITLNPVTTGQYWFVKEPGYGSYWNGHAMLYVGHGKVIHATSGNSRATPPRPAGVYEEDLSYFAHYKLVVYRCTNTRAAQAAVEQAKAFAAHDPGIKYATGHCARGAVHSSVYGDNAANRHNQVLDGSWADGTPWDANFYHMMCNELVCFSYQANAKHFINADCKYVSSQLLEHAISDPGLNDGLFELLGGIPQVDDHAFLEEQGSAKEGKKKIGKTKPQKMSKLDQDDSDAEIFCSISDKAPKDFDTKWKKGVKPTHDFSKKKH